MTKQLTDSERTYMNQARTDLFDGVDLGSIKPEIANSASFRSGFITGLEYNQAKLDKLIAELAEVKEELRITKRALNDG